jgi:hypothetical protein
MIIIIIDSRPVTSLSINFPEACSSFSAAQAISTPFQSIGTAYFCRLLICRVGYEIALLSMLCFVQVDMSFRGPST